MNISELYKFATWLKVEIGQMMPHYQAVFNVLQHNAREAQKQPVEDQIKSLTTLLANQNLDVLTGGQIRLIDLFKVRDLFSLEGIKFIDSTIRTSDFDPATASNTFKDSIDRLNTADSRVDSIISAFSDITGIMTETEVAADRVLVRIEFVGEASIDDVSKWKSWSTTWYDIIRGIGLVLEEPPENTLVVGASQGSIILSIAATLGMTKVLASISKSVASIASDYLEIRMKMEELTAKKILNKAAETAMKKNADDIKKDGAKKAVEDIEQVLPNEINGEQRTALENSVIKALDFFEKGGDLDFVAPSPPKDEPDAAEIANPAERQLISEVRQIIEDARRDRSNVQLLIERSDEGE